MVDRPDSLPEVATATNYSTGPHVGLPTKLAPETVDIEQGNIATVHPNARKFNWWQNLVYKWLSYFDNQIRRGIEADPNGVHSAERGCLYTSQTDNSWWKNVDGDNVWERVYLVPDPSAEPDGNTLQTQGGAAVWVLGDSVAHADLEFDDHITYGFNLTADFDLDSLPDSCVIMARASAVWGATTGGDTSHIEKDGAAVLYLTLTKNGGDLVQVLFGNGDESAAQFHAMVTEAFDPGGASPSTEGIITAEISSGNLQVNVYLPGTGAYSGPTMTGRCALRAEEIFEREELPEP